MSNFSSSQAASSFYEKHMKVDSKNVSEEKSEDSVLFSVYPPFERKHLSSPAIRLNKSIDEADIDKNGVISMKEAQSFRSGSSKKH